MSQPPTSRPGPQTPGGSAPVDPPRKKRPAWLVPLVAAVVVALLLLLLLSRCGDGDDTAGGTTGGAGAGSAPSTSDTAPSTPATPSNDGTDETDETAQPDATATPETSPTTAPAPSTGAGAGVDTTLVTADGTSVLALAAESTGAGAGGSDDTGLATVEGQDVHASGVRVESVPADEGFWLGTGDQRVWAQLDGPGESDFTVETGQQLTFTARVVTTDDGFAQSVGVDDAEGAAQLQAQGQHLLVDRSTLALAG